MSENETQNSTKEETAVKTETSSEQETSTKKSPIKLYAVALVVVAVVIVGVIYLLEKEGRSSTNFFGSYIAAQEEKRVVATVNGQDIINKDLNTSVEQFRQMADSQGVDTTNADVQSEIRSQALDVLINTGLLKQAAQERGLSISDEEVTNRLEEIKAEIGGEEVLNERMESLGIGADKLQSDIKDELLIQALLDQVFAEANIEVTEEEIAAIYEQAGGGDAGLPSLEEVSAQIEAQLLSSKEQEVIDGYLSELRDGAEINIEVE
ncbi:SurA N-terminal domain-containing protein [Candidatus Kaiserbacteria bacterium]|nr:SurA N-terminal domain-containing protein [Candidatus Kaiserbacteria bacterium]MCB9818548.1 SurA N-terminal domain-containing protein [Candidatus Nomurabacteria bacterium]